MKNVPAFIDHYMQAEKSSKEIGQNVNSSDVKVMKLSDFFTLQIFLKLSYL